MNAMSNTQPEDSAMRVMPMRGAPSGAQVETTSPPPAPLPRPSCPISLPPLPVSPGEQTLSGLTAFMADPAPQASAPASLVPPPRPHAPITQTPLSAPLRLDTPTRARRAVEQPTQAIQEILNALLRSNADIQACAVISFEGLMIASASPEPGRDARVAGITAVLGGLAERAATLLGRGALEQVFLQGGHGYALIAEASSDTLLLVLAPASASLGLFFRDAEDAATRLLAAA